VWIAFYDAHPDLTFNNDADPDPDSDPDWHKPMLIRMWFLPKVLHILESKANFFTFIHNNASLHVFLFSYVANVS
jgi:hypothetical protein